nr:xylulose kinase-1 [Tanacetum cinerariifolium]
MWEAIKSKFGGNEESKKMHKYLLKQQFEGFSVSSSESLHKGVFKRDVKCTNASSSSNTHNVAFVYADNTSSTNDVSTAYSVSSPSVSKSQKEGSASYTDEVMHSFFANQSRHFARDCRAKWNQDSRRRDGGYNRNKARDNSRRPASQGDSKALVTIDGEVVDSSGHIEEDTQNFAMMAYSFSNSGSNNESVFMNKEYDLENTLVNDRYAKGMHTVPLPMIRNYMPSRPVVEIDYSKFTYGPKQTSADESDSKPVEYASSDSDSIWTDALIIEEYESDSDDDLVFNVQEDKEKPSFAFTDSVKFGKSHRENDKEISTPNHYPKIEKQDRHSHTRKGPKEANHSVGTKANDDQDANSEEIDLHDEHFVRPVWFAYSTFVKSSRTKIQKTTDCKTSEKPDVNTNNTNLLNVVSVPVSVVGPSRALNDDEPSYPDDLSMPHLEDIYASPSAGIFTNSSYDDEGVTRSKVHKNSEAHALICLLKLLVSAAKEVGQAQDDVSIPTEPSTSKPPKKHKSKKQQPKDKEESFKWGRMITDMDEDVEDIDEEKLAEVEEVLEVVTAVMLIIEVVTTAAPTTIAVQVPKASASRRRRGVIIQDPEETAALVIHYNLVKAFLKKKEEDVNVQEKDIEEESNKRQGESLEQDIAKKQRMDKEAEELKRADGTHKLFLSFITLLKNIDKEDSEALWKLFKERFETTDPKNILDDFLLNIIKIMFEKPDIEANMILLVEKKYPLTYFTLQEMLDNVRLEVSEESEMPLELLSNKVYGGDLKGFGVNPLSDEFRLCNSDEWRPINGGGPLGIRSYGGGDMVIHDGLKGCLDHQILRSLPILPPLQ